MCFFASCIATLPVFHSHNSLAKNELSLSGGGALGISNQGIPGDNGITPTRTNGFAGMSMALGLQGEYGITNRFNAGAFGYLGLLSVFGCGLSTRYLIRQLPFAINSGVNFVYERDEDGPFNGNNLIAIPELYFGFTKEFFIGFRSEIRSVINEHIHIIPQALIGYELNTKSNLSNRNTEIISLLSGYEPETGLFYLNVGVSFSGYW